MAPAPTPAGPPSSPGRRRLGTRGLALVAVITAVFAAFVGGMRSALAEEAVVLDNGAILRGNILREDGETLVVRLSGVGSDAKVTIDRRRVVQRFVTVEPGSPSVPAASLWTPSADATGAVGTVGTVAPGAARTVPPPTYVAPPPLPEEEPRAAEETFLRRSARRAELALPGSAGPRAFLVVAALLVAICLVGLATKMADVPFAGLGRTTLLAVLFCALIAVAWTFSDTFARADRTAVLVPTLLVAWMGVAAGVLRCGLLQAFHLLAFVLVSSALVLFTSAVVLVSV